MRKTASQCTLEGQNMVHTEAEFKLIGDISLPHLFPLFFSEKELEVNIRIPLLSLKVENFYVGLIICCCHSIFNCN